MKVMVSVSNFPNYSSDLLFIFRICNIFNILILFQGLILAVSMLSSTIAQPLFFPATAVVATTATIEAVAAAAAASALGGATAAVAEAAGIAAATSATAIGVAEAAAAAATAGVAAGATAEAAGAAGAAAGLAAVAAAAPASIPISTLIAGKALIGGKLALAHVLLNSQQ